VLTPGNVAHHAPEDSRSWNLSGGPTSCSPAGITANSIWPHAHPRQRHCGGSAREGCRHGSMPGRNPRHLCLGLSNRRSTSRRTRPWSFSWRTDDLTTNVYKREGGGLLPTPFPGDAEPHPRGASPVLHTVLSRPGPVKLVTFSPYAPPVQVLAYPPATPPPGPTVLPQGWPEAPRVTELPPISTVRYPCPGACP